MIPILRKVRLFNYYPRDYEWSAYAEVAMNEGEGEIRVLVEQNTTARQCMREYMKEGETKECEVSLKSPSYHPFVTSYTLDDGVEILQRMSLTTYSDDMVNWVLPILEHITYPYKRSQGEKGHVKFSVKNIGKGSGTAKIELRSLRTGKSFGSKEIDLEPHEEYEGSIEYTIPSLDKDKFVLSSFTEDKEYHTFMFTVIILPKMPTPTPTPTPTPIPCENAFECIFPRLLCKEMTPRIKWDTLFPRIACLKQLRKK